MVLFMPMINRLSCCGVGEITGLSYTPNQTFRDQLAQILPNVEFCYFLQPKKTFVMRRGAFIFTSAVSEEGDYAEQFAAKITKHKLGKTYALPKFRNPNTSHPITIHVWIVDKTALLAYCRKQKLVGLITER